MLKKLFGNKDIPPLPDQAQLQRLLAEVALRTPKINWIALVQANGAFSSFPSKSDVEADRISAMGAAMSALGERIAFELKDGEMQYILVAGTNGISITIELSPDKYFLTIGLDKDVSIEEFLSRMQKTNLSLLLKALHIEGDLQLPGIRQN